MKRLLCVLSLSLLFLAPAACADPKAYEAYGMSDPTGALNEPAIIGRVDAVLGKIYGDFGVSVFFNVNYGDPDAAASDFYEYSVEPYLGDDGIKRGIVLGWAAEPKLGRASDYGVAVFPPEDGGEIERIYPFDFISGTVEKLAKKSPRERDFFEALARELYERAKDFHSGAGAKGGGEPPASLEAPGGFNVSVKRDEYGDARIQVGFAVPESVAAADAMPGITVTFELDWNIGGEGWASENGDKGIIGFAPHSVGAADGPFGSEPVPGDYRMFAKGQSYQFRGYFEFQSGGKTIRSPYTEVVKAGE
ncbi:MAG: hypothetical protein LBU26_05720 [Synergistaceae bacterium]|nr:hypothetical protein [Synergistaceae bacterium]